MDLFSQQAEEEQRANAPLAARMRPQSLDELIGQEEVVGAGKLLRRAIETDRLTSLILYGPPGTGKTTIARIIAGHTESTFRTLNAVTAGVADIRKVVEEAKEALSMYQKRTVLFVDEIHRFNKSQQDALLPHVEEGLIILIGATTENPFFEVNAALLSRSQIFRLQPHSEQDLVRMAKRALELPDRGLGHFRVDADEEALEHLARFAEGDARRMYNALELSVLSTRPDANGVIHLTLDVAAESIQRRVVRYDKNADQHYDTVSAFIKSIRGSDPDGALYWLAKMIDAGEDAKFIARRLVISASEDIGNADPRALQIAVSAFQAIELIGMPEGRIVLGQAATYLATAPKSNAAYMGINQALAMIQNGSSTEVPPHLRDAHYKGASRLGHGKGYLYPHDFPGNFVEQRYLPEGLGDHIFYAPTRNGYEQVISERLHHWRSRRNGG
ncbi:replication-associated recombination protein A [Tumebacillus sp. DT12]|uniref:Replication-associated recombination protein A n=1 Tax=Tumebacillus lacus TaxID=2995335 RepID=A0ABT3X0A2_9BACL|nr:replication-associated recombination protein A [Tumebacillus lacus]MCX7570330.1 replication-associated recombination protein A [Tumebacillus lacus]